MCVGGRWRSAASSALLYQRIRTVVHTSREIKLVDNVYDCELYEDLCLFQG